MKAPTQRQPKSKTLMRAPEGLDLEGVARRVSYVGSSEHKGTRSFAGPAAPRADATLCPPEFKDRQEELTGWLQESIRDGWTGGPWEGDFPRYVWCVKEGRFYEGRLTNQHAGHYKGYPVRRIEVPEELLG